MGGMQGVTWSRGINVVCRSSSSVRRLSCYYPRPCPFLRWLPLAYACSQATLPHPS